MRKRLARIRSWRTVPALAVGIAVLNFLWVSRVYAADEGQQLHLFSLSMGLFGGLALFLYGMDTTSDALKSVAGARMRTILSKLVTNRIMGLVTGVIVTAIIQSSSVTTVMLISLITAGLISFSQAVSVILGANIGTTITVQIIALKVTQYSLLLLAVGFLLSFTGKGKKRYYGYWLMGLGFIFLGMDVMGNAMVPLKDYKPFVNLMATVTNPWWSLLIAAVFTALVQTSAATVAIAIVFASQGLIDLYTAIALILGANIGTSATAALASIGKPPEAVRAAVAHVLFKTIGALIVLPFIPQLAQIVVAISPKWQPGMSEAMYHSKVLPRQIANAHTVFNVGIALLFLPFSSLAVRFIEWLVPDRDNGLEGLAAKPRYLDDSLVDTPHLALGMVRREVNRMGDVLEQMLEGIPEAVFEGDLDKMEGLKEKDEKVDALFAAITRYLAKIGQEDIPEDVADEVLGAMSALTELEAIGDIIENNLAHLARRKVEENIVLDEQALAVLTEYHLQVTRAFKSAIVAFVSDNKEIARMVMEMKSTINNLDIQARARMAAFLRQTLTPHELASYTLEMDIMDNLKRIYYHTKRVAKLVAQEEGAADWQAVPSLAPASS